MPDSDQPPAQLTSSGVVRFVASLPVIVPIFLALLAASSTFLMLCRSFHGPLALIVATVLTVLVMTRLGLGDRHLARRALALDVLAVLLALGFAGFNAAHSAQNIVISRDPGVYSVASRWLVTHTSTDVDTHFRLFGDDPAIQSNSAGIGRRPELGHVYPQGSHGLPAVLSVGGSLFGSRVIYASNSVLGGFALLAVYGFGRRVVGRRGALGGAALLGLSLPQIYFSRDTYTEPLSQLLLFGGLALLLGARRGRPLDWAVAGLVTAGSCLVRIDSFLVLPPLILSAGLWLALAPPDRRRTTARDTAALAAGALVPAVLGYLDLKHFAAGYLHTLEDQFGQIQKLTVLSVVVAVVAVALAWTTRLVAGLSSLRAVTRSRLGLAAGSAFALGMAALALRPLFHLSQGIKGPGQMAFLSRLQYAEGDAIEPTRSYAESSVTWLSWYLGPVALVLGVLGIAVLLARAVRRGDPALVPFFLALGLTGVVYLINPSITPDQMWAMRRYLPIVLPGLALGSAVLIMPALAWLAHRTRAGAALAGVAVLAALFVPVYQVSQPLLGVREGVGQLNEVKTVCAALPDDAAVLVLGALANRYPMTLRAFCDVPAVWTTSKTAGTPAALAAMATRLRSEGYQLYVVGAGDLVAEITATTAPVPLLEITTRAIEQTLSRPPRTARSASRGMLVGRVSDQGEVSAWLTRK
ncbi:MAG: hypothetical protein ABIO67_08050 [Mycobacteriales bacterium]